MNTESLQIATENVRIEVPKNIYAGNSSCYRLVRTCILYFFLFQTICLSNLSAPQGGTRNAVTFWDVFFYVIRGGWKMVFCCSDDIVINGFLRRPLHRNQKMLNCQECFF